MDNLTTVQSPSQFASSGLPATLLANNLDLDVLRPYPGKKMPSGLVVNEALLRQDEWKQVDSAMIQIARGQLNGIQDLINAGLVYQLGGLGTMVSQYERESDLEEASVNMSGTAADTDDALDFDVVSVPVPIISKGFTLNIRRLLASRNMGEALDTSQVRVSTRRVVDKMEEILFDGQSTVNVNGNTIYGYRTHPDRNTGSGADFGTIANIYTSLSNMVSAAEADNFRGGPYIVYLAQDQYAQMRAIHTDGSGQSALRRVLDNIPGLVDVKLASAMTAGEAVLVTMRSDVVDLARAQDLTVVNWDSHGGMTAHFKVMTAVVPRIKSDKDGKSGIVHYTGV